MRKLFISCLAYLALAVPLWGQTVKLPAEIKGTPGAFITIPAETDCDKLFWNVIDKPGAPYMGPPYTPEGSGLNLFPMELLKDSKTAVVSSLVPGKYRIQVYGIKGSNGTQIVECLIIVGTPPVPPGPFPPVPPGPTPPPQPVPPVDPFLATLQAALNEDIRAGNGTVNEAGILAAVYRTGAEKVMSPTLNTVGAFYSVLRQAGIGAVPAERLTALRMTIAKELDKVLPLTPNMPLDDATRKLIADKLKWAANLLDQLKA